MWNFCKIDSDFQSVIRRLTKQNVRLIWKAPEKYIYGEAGRDAAGLYIKIDPALSLAKAYAVLLHEISHICNQDFKTESKSPRQSRVGAVAADQEIAKVAYDFRETRADWTAYRFDKWARDAAGSNSVILKLAQLKNYQEHSLPVKKG